MQAPSRLDKRHAEKLAKFTDTLSQSRFWHVLPQGQNNIDEATGFFDTQTGLLYPPVPALKTFLNAYPFVFVRKVGEQTNLATLHSATKLLWNNESSQYLYSLNEGKQLVAQARWCNLEGWKIPVLHLLELFAGQSCNPHRHNDALFFHGGATTTDWLFSGGINGDCVWHSKNFFARINGRQQQQQQPKMKAAIFAYNPLWEDKSDIEIAADLIQRHWALVTPGGAAFKPSIDTRWQGLSTEALMLALAEEKIALHANGKSGLVLLPDQTDGFSDFTLLDHTPCRLPKLDRAQLTDPEKGLWELWGEPPETLARFGLVARDPGLDLQRRAVAIDFGTSSTVVAMDTPSGARELVRIGVRDFYQAIDPAHFENPTVLECLDFPAFHAVWTHTAYRPALDWDWMRAAHEAQASFRDNPGDTRRLASLLPRLKQWALRSHEHRRVRLSDRQGHELELPLHTERNPVRGQPLAVSPDDPFDPIELYAWYLGMAINWRGRGLFLTYYLSFPVKYPLDVKHRTLASFRRGLQRSLPQSLIEHHPDVLNRFEVSELASEPAAYAAAALPHLGVEPTEEGVPYAVFDFGGGTTDFDFGLYRWAKQEEEDQGYERVFEHLASSGDNFLGGENLLEHLVYEVFKQNLGLLRTHRIQFTSPLDGVPFPGSEAFLAPTQAAQTNTVMLSAKLRPFLEGETAEMASQLMLELMDANGQKHSCELVVKVEALETLLAQRMENGVRAFVAEMARLGALWPKGAPIQVLLAGNGSRSRYIKALFEGEGFARLLSEAFGEAVPEVVVHPPLPMDAKNPHAPTAKTGVALGLLRLMPGKNTLLMNHVHTRHDGQAPFGWFVGRMRRGRLEPVLLPDTAYGDWHELGRLQEGIFYLFASTSPRAHTGLAEGDPELRQHRQEFPAAPVGARLFGKAIGPGKLALCPALDKGGIDEHLISEFTLG